MGKYPKRRFRKSDQISPQEQFRQQRESSLVLYRRAVELSTRGEQPPFRLENILHFAGKSAAEFQADVMAERQRQADQPYWYRPENGPYPG